MAGDERYDRTSLQGLNPNEPGHVSAQEAELLVRLMEESAELTHACAKILRWGWASKNPLRLDLGTNEEQLHCEASDVELIYHRLTSIRERA